VVAICGDYGFQMHGTEVATCVHHQIGVVFAIMNDARMRMVESGQTRVFGRAGLLHSHRIDFAAMGRAMGARGFNIRTPEDFRKLPEDLMRSNIPTVLDIEIDPNSSFPVNGRTAQIRNFSAQ
jgi:acetolactate synthase-1/2/3 large subunit